MYRIIKYFIEHRFSKFFVFSHSFQNMNNMVEIISCDFNNSLHTKALTELVNHYMQDEMGGADPLNEDEQKKLVEGLGNHPSKLVLLAEENGNFLGLANCFINFGTFAVKPFINIHDVVVLKSSRGKGVGKKLMEGVIEEAKKLDCGKITLEVREDNVVAQNLYKSYGYCDSEPKMFFWTRKL